MEDSPRAPRDQPAGLLQRWLRKALTLAIVTVVFGWFYGWASPWAFPKSRTADFKYGVLHGALMPLSLPTLLMGKDVPIYAPRQFRPRLQNRLYLRHQSYAAWSFSARRSGGQKSHQPSPKNLNNIQYAAGPIMIRRQGERFCLVVERQRRGLRRVVRDRRLGNQCRAPVSAAANKIML